MRDDVVPKHLELTDRNVIVLGLGVTGCAVASVLADHGAHVLASDLVTPKIEGLDELASRGIEIETGGHDRAAEALKDAHFVVPSPGISPHRGFLADVVAAGTPIVSELDLAIELTDAPVLAVTGTNGKTTVCLLAERIARMAGMKAFMCGNTESPFLSSAAEHPEADLFVVEASSFRLAFCRTFHPHVAVITNFAPDHLDWHSSLDDYREAKARIASRLGATDLLLYPATQPELAEMAPADGPRRVPFGTNQAASCDAAWLEGDEVVVGFGERSVRAGGIGALAARAPHFASNAVAAAAGVVFLGADASSVERGLEGFEVAQHRLEPVGTLNGIRVIDDSVAANTHATLAALRQFDRVVLIAGGRNKGIDLTPLASEAGRIKALVALGEAADELTSVFSGTEVPVETVGSMTEAVGVALGRASSGDVVLLSPACASLDMFRNYADRGRAFREACRAYGVR